MTDSPLPQLESLRHLASRLAQLHVLIADPDTRIAQVVEDVLRHIGFRNIYRAIDGAEALRILRQQAQIDLLITDWLVEPEEGSDCVHYIRHHPDSPNPRMPIIMLTGRAGRSTVEKARDAGITEFIVKPFGIKTLFDRLVQIVENPRAFVFSRRYSGPDRRRRKDPAHEAQERRGAEAALRQRIDRQDMLAIEQGTVSACLLPPDDRLRKVIGENAGIRNLLLPDVVATSQEVVRISQGDFLNWVDEKLNELDRIYHLAAQNHQAKTAIDALLPPVFVIKSQAGIFGYTLASEVAYSLHDYLEHRAGAVADGKSVLIVIKQHIDALFSIFQLRLEGDGEKTGRDLIESLRLLTRKYSA